MSLSNIQFCSVLIIVPLLHELQQRKKGKREGEGNKERDKEREIQRFSEGERVWAEPCTTFPASFPMESTSEGRIDSMTGYRRREMEV